MTIDMTINMKINMTINKTIKMTINTTIKMTINTTIDMTIHMSYIVAIVDYRGAAASKKLKLKCILSSYTLGCKVNKI